MPRKTQLFLANFDPPALPAGRSFSEVLAAMNTLLATASPWVRAEAAPVTLPVLVARPGLFGPVELADVGTRLTDLLALSASHGDWAIVGGTRTFPGVIIGGIVLMVFDESLRFAEQLRPGVYGVLLILVMLFWPQGLERLFQRSAAQRADAPAVTPSPDAKARA